MKLNQLRHIIKEEILREIKVSTTNHNLDPKHFDTEEYIELHKIQKMLYKEGISSKIILVPSLDWVDHRHDSYYEDKYDQPIGLLIKSGTNELVIECDTAYDTVYFTINVKNSPGPAPAENPYYGYEMGEVLPVVLTWVEANS